MVPAVTAIGEEKSASCQPDAESLVNVTWPEQGPVGGPQLASVGAGIGRALVEADAGDPPVHRRGELHAKVHRAGIVRRRAVTGEVNE